MENNITHKILTIILAAVLLLGLHGCMLDIEPEKVPLVSAVPVAVEETGSLFASPATVRGLFTLRYNSKNMLNPITSASSDNILLSTLMYEPLFSLDSVLKPKPILCESWLTEDNITYTFEIKPDIAMSDGSMLTADDVAYTLNQSMRSGRYSRRLSIIKSVTSNGELTVTIVLKSPNRRLIHLLDIPIIKNGYIEYNVPPGTGPYIFMGDEARCLNRFTGYRHYEELPLAAIYLRECDDDEAVEDFEDGKLSLLWDDPSDTYDLRLNRIRETRDYDTTALQYIGFNMRSEMLIDPDVRRAIGHSIERDYIANEIMGGHALGAPLALSPAYAMYNVEWERPSLDPLKEMSALLLRAGFEDYDDDSFFEYPDEKTGEYRKFTIDFIVNSDNTYKTRAAHKIADTLRRTGFDIVVRELPWDAFTDALETAQFDMYYGEIVLNADFDLSSLLLPSSKLNYGKTGDSSYAPLIENFISASTDEEERIAAEALCKEIRDWAPFAPILYKKYAIYTQIRAISGAAPSQSGVYREFDKWTIDLSMLS